MPARVLDGEILEAVSGYDNIGKAVIFLGPDQTTHAVYLRAFRDDEVSAARVLFQPPIAGRWSKAAAPATAIQKSNRANR